MLGLMFVYSPAPVFVFPTCGDEDGGEATGEAQANPQGDASELRSGSPLRLGTKPRTEPRTDGAGWETECGGVRHLRWGNWQSGGSEE